MEPGTKNEGQGASGGGPHAVGGATPDATEKARSVRGPYERSPPVVKAGVGARGRGTPPS